MKFLEKSLGNFWRKSWITSRRNSWRNFRRHSWMNIWSSSWRIRRKSSYTSATPSKLFWEAHPSEFQKNLVPKKSPHSPGMNSWKSSFPETKRREKRKQLVSKTFFTLYSAVWFGCNKFAVEGVTNLIAIALNRSVWWCDVMWCDACVCEFEIDPCVPSKKMSRNHHRRLPYRRRENFGRWWLSLHFNLVAGLLLFFTVPQPVILK